MIASVNIPASTPGAAYGRLLDDAIDRRPGYSRSINAIDAAPAELGELADHFAGLDAATLRSAWCPMVLSAVSETNGLDPIPLAALARALTAVSMRFGIDKIEITPRRQPREELWPSPPSRRGPGRQKSAWRERIESIEPGQRLQLPANAMPKNALAHHLVRINKRRDPWHQLGYRTRPDGGYTIALRDDLPIKDVHRNNSKRRSLCRRIEPLAPGERLTIDASEISPQELGNMLHQLNRRRSEARDIGFRTIPGGGGFLVAHRAELPPPNRRSPEKP